MFKKSDSVWLLRLGHKRQWSFSLVHWDTLIWRPESPCKKVHLSWPAMPWGSSGHMWRPYSAIWVSTITWGTCQQPAPSTLVMLPPDDTSHLHSVTPGCSVFPPASWCRRNKSFLFWFVWICDPWNLWT